jgi:hypothetical protein
LREHLHRAGITREELFADDETRAPLTLHDLRATGITWCAVRGADPIKIQRRAGHTDLATTQRYIREAENIDARFGVPFPILPASVVGAAAPSAASAVPLSNGPGNGPATPPRSANVANQRGESRRCGWDSNRESPDLHAEEHVEIGVGDSTDSDAQVRERSSADQSPDQTRAPRAALVEALTNAIRDATLAGDLAAARVALDAITRLVADAERNRATGEGAMVVDLAERKRDRDG